MRAHVLLSGAPGHPDVAVPAVVRGHLALHSAHLRSGWRITHKPSGKCIGHFPTCQAARRAFRQIAVFDWRFADRGGPAFNIVKNAVPPIIFSCGGVPYDPPFDEEP